MKKPDFYLASSEGYELEAPRQCWRIKRLVTNERNDFLLIKIDPPIIGQKFGLGGQDIFEVLVATRFSDDSLYPIKKWPVFVYVSRLLIENPELIESLSDNDFELIAWAELYESEESAKVKCM
jgi:hypothetical protein